MQLFTWSNIYHIMKITHPKNLLELYFTMLLLSDFCRREIISAFNAFFGITIRLSLQRAVSTGLSIFEYLSLSGNETPDPSMSRSARTMNAVDIRSTYGFLCFNSSNVRESNLLVSVLSRISKCKTFHFGFLISCHIN